jgi:hypothetical protein
MPGFATRHNTKQRLVTGVLSTTLAALVGLFWPGVSALSASQLWSVRVHIEYDNGDVYDNAFVTGVAASALPSFLEACGSAHRFNRSVLRYHCYPVLED